MSSSNETDRNLPFEGVLLETIDLCKYYPDGDVKALHKANVCLGNGEFVAIMGPSGSGKSTLLSMLGALDIPTTGEILFKGKRRSEWGSLDQFRSQELGFVFQSFFLLPTLTAVENVQIPMFETSVPLRDRITRAHELLETVGLKSRADHLPMQLSIGERQRVAIARSLANNPALLLADEPTGNLDSKNAAEIMNLFHQLHDNGMTIAMVTHSDEIASHADRVIRLRDGQIEVDQAVAGLRVAGT